MLRWIRARIIGRPYLPSVRDQVHVAKAVIPAAAQVSLANIDVARTVLSQVEPGPLRQQRAQLTAARMALHAALCSVETALHQIATLRDEGER